MTPKVTRYLKKATFLVFAISLATLASDPALGAIELKQTDQPTIELFALILGGLGIFLIGIHYSGDHLQKMAGIRFQNVVHAVSNHKLGIFIWGIFLGSITQSGKATAFILSDIVYSECIYNYR